MATSLVGEAIGGVAVVKTSGRSRPDMIAPIFVTSAAASLAPSVRSKTTVAPESVWSGEASAMRLAALIES